MNDIPKKPSDLIDQILNTAKAALPDNLSDDLKNNVRSVIEEVISDLDVVSREELDIQKNVLAKTRAKVDEMEALISELEKKLDESS